MKAKQPKKNIWTEYPLVRILTAMLAISVVILIIVFVGIRIYSRQGQEVELPDYMGRQLDEVMAEDDIGLNFVVMDSLYQKGTEGGTILLQDPKGGGMVKPGRKVYVTISSYKVDDAVVPEIIDLALKPAMSKLRNAGLLPGRLTFVESEFATIQEASHNGNNVFSGQKLPNGSKVDLVVGMGNNTRLATIPMLLGKTLESSEKALLNASLNEGMVHFDRDVKDRTKAVIYKQEPEYTGVAGYPLGTSVELWLKEMSSAEAEQMVREFRVDSSKIVSNDINSMIGDIMDEDNWGVEW